MRSLILFSILFFMFSAGCSVPQKNDDKSGTPDYQDLHNGIFIHYTYVGKPYRWGSTPWADGTPVESLNELADNLDVPDLVALAESARAQYLIFTTFHANMQVLFPSKVMDRYLPGHTSRRDVIGDLIAALKAKNIQIIIYFHPSDAHDMTEEDQSLTGGNDPMPRERWNDFVNELLSEILERYGKDISGFLIDGGLPRYVDAARLRATIKDYSPQLWIIQNAGLNPRCADYAANEDNMSPPFPSTSWMMMQRISSEWWAKKEGNAIYNPEFAYCYTVLQAAVANRLGGGAAWSFGPYPDGYWELGVRSFCRDLGQFFDKAGKSLFGTRPSQAYLTVEKQGLLETQYVATESKDGKTTYLHVFHPPQGKTLKLPSPVNGRQFKSAQLFSNKNKVTLQQDAGGLTLILQPSDKWDNLDTIIEIE